MPSFSPRLQAFSAPAPTSDQAKTLFEQGLSQMAYNVLLSKFPNLAPDVVTFKILDSEPEQGNGVGSFVVTREGHTFYIPVVMAENQVKPLDLLYFKDMNVFLPLTKEWLEQLSKQSLGELGHGTKPPNTLQTDVDIRNTVVPPTTGRYSYAAEQDAAAPFFALEETPSEPKLAFLEVISKAPNRVKKAAAEFFETRPKLLKHAVKYYGKTAFVNALAFTQEKVADYGHRLSRTGALYIADKSTASGAFKDIFGADAPIAYQGMLRKGYAVKDTRPEVKQALQVQPYTDYHEPKDAGAYRLWKADGTPFLAFVLGNPVDLTNPQANRVPARNIRFRLEAESPAAPAQGNGVNYRMPGADGTEGRTFVNRFIGVSEDGKLIDVTKLLGSSVPMGELEGSAVYKKTVGAASAAGPRAGQTGFFVMRKGGSFVGTRPVRVESVTSDSEGTKLVKVMGGGGLRTLAIHKDHANGMLLVPADGIIHVPANYAWIPTSGELHASELMTNPKDILRWGLQSITKTAAERVLVKKGYHGFTFGETSKEGFEFIPALRKLATEAGISVEDAEAALKTAEEKGRVEFYAVSREDSAKLAALDKHAAEAPPPRGEQGQPPADPAQQAMDEVQMAQMGAAPQGPSPIDMAVAEQMQNLQSQMQALTQMQQLMQTVQQRANQIAGTGGVQGNPAAAAAAMGGPMDPSMMGAGAPTDPSMGAPPPDPMQGAPMQGAPMQGAPMQGAPMQGAPMQGAPQEQPPPAMMSAEDGDPSTLAQQVNPQFMEQAGSLNDAGVFDAATLASMAQSPVLRDLVQAYMPNLEKSLDNIGRILLTLWMDESHIKEDMGADTYVGLEDNLRTVLKGLGELILKVNQNALVLRDPSESVFQG